MLKTCGPLLLVAFATVPTGLRAAEMSAEQAWKALPKYEAGQDMAGLLTIDLEVIAAMKTPETRVACAAKLADLLANEDTTLAAKQYICLQLRQVGTRAQVPLLATLLQAPETTEMARYALESIPGSEATAALRAAVTKLTGKPLVGVIGSVAQRKDTSAVADLTRLADSDDPQVAMAAVQALANINDRVARQYLIGQANESGVPTAQVLAVGLLRCAGSGRDTEEIYTMLSQPGQLPAIRRASLEGLLRFNGEETDKTVLDWFSSEDADRRRVAAGHLHELSDQHLDQLLAHLSELPNTGRLAVVELAAARRGAAVLPMVMSLVEDSNPGLKQAGIRCLGAMGDPTAIPVLLHSLATGGEVAEAAQDALASLPRNAVTTSLLETLQSQPKLRVPVIAVLIEIKCYDAIDPLIEIAANADPAEYGPALNGLRGIADPDKTDIPKLIKLLLRSEAGQHRDDVEKTILIVCNKLEPSADRSQLVLASLATVDESETPKYLPLLGRLGGEASMTKIETSLESSNKAIHQAAVRAFCNWPGAEVADKLLKVATDSDDRVYRRMALRAYIRVVSLKSERPEAETLAMLKNAFELAAGVDEKRLAIQRATTVRTMDNVAWLAQFLDNVELGQAACASLVELAHHRFLRHPNMKTFGPILEQVAEISNDPEIVSRAKRYRLGL